MLRPFYIWMLVFPMLCASCGGNTAYHHYQPVPSQGWGRLDTLSFLLPGELAQRSCRMVLELRHNEQYAYQDIWIALLHAPDSHVDTFRLTLAGSDGMWYGKGHAGSLYQYASAPQGISLSASDSLMRLVHVMEDSCLVGITDVGIRLLLPGSVDAEKDK